jgi:hypothetical protein
MNTKASLRVGEWRVTAALVMLTTMFALPMWAQTNVNYWTNSTTGKWEDTNSWSLGMLPDVSQAAVVSQYPIMSATVVIDSTTAQNFPQSLTVGGLEVLPGNTIVLSNTIAGIAFQVTNSIEMPAGGTYDQKVGTTTASAFNLGGGTAWLRKGTMFLGSLNMGIQGPQGLCSFTQSPGTTNFTGGINLGIGAEQYELDGGVLYSGNVTVDAYKTTTTFQQNGGVHIVTNSVSISGCAGHNCVGGYYVLTNGLLLAQTLQLDDSGGWATFWQNGGETLISGSVQGSGPAVARGSLAINGGTFGCNDFGIVNNGIVDIGVSGGAMIVTNLLRFVGYTPGEQSPGLYIKPGFPDFNLSEGTLWASNIEVTANFDIASSLQAGRITNPGYFKLAGTINVGDANEQFGQFILATDVATNVLNGVQTPIDITTSLINFSGSNTVLAFARSDSQTWSNGATLVVSNWSGSYGGGGNEQLIFGTSASGLTQAQLSQIFFVNPAGLPLGQYSARILSSGEIVPATGSINYWIKGATGAWQETNSWSLHMLPSASQSIFITGSWLNVSVNPDTKWNYPETLTVGDVTVGGSATTFMLDWISTNVPFHALNGLTVLGESPTNRNTLLCLESGLFVDSRGLYVTNGQVIQDGGFIHVTNADTWLNNAEFYLTNGFFDVATLWLGFAPTNQYSHGTAAFFQYGGTVTASNIYDGSVGSSNVYNIYGGELNAGSITIGEISSADFNQYGGRVTAGGISLSSQSVTGDHYNLFDGELTTGALNMFSYWGSEVFFQSGGTNRASSLSLSSIVLGGDTRYILGDGLLLSSNEFFGFNATLEQDGGKHIVTGTLTLQGQADRYGTDFAWCLVTNSYLSAPNFKLQCGWLRIGNSLVSVADTLYLNLAAENSRFSEIGLSSGTLSCSNAISDGAGSDISQSGGSFIVTNFFKFGGHRDWYGYDYPVYTFSGGTFVSPNIELDAEWTIGSSGTTGRIVNTGYFQQSGILDIGDANEHLGRFILGDPVVRTQTGVAVGTNAMINFTGTSTILAFADSSHEAWSSSNLLMVANWNGELNGGGQHQLKFGSNGLGLTAGQVGHIRFVNPAGFPTGTYAAKILSTGEVVPDAPGVSASVSGNGIVISWPDSSYSLQFATNVLGPWTNLVATSPYTNNFAESSQGFFRLSR